MNLYELALSLIPILIALVIIVFIRYKYPSGTIQPLFYSFVLGCIMSLGVILFRYLIAQAGLDELKNLKRMAFYAFVVTGGSAEFFKFLVLRFYAVPLKIFRGSADGIVYSVMISMGMTTVLSFVFAFDRFLPQFDFYYAMLGTLAIANLVFAIIMGFFAGMGKSRNNRFVDSLTGLAAAAFLNGLYHFCFFTHEYMLAILAASGSFIIAAVFIVMVVKSSGRES
jgi:RsiW-degrading membrane proteinase PrsW (M82 family)